MAHICFIPEDYPSQARPSASLFFRDQAEALATLGGHQVGVVCPASLGWLRWGRSHLRLPIQGGVTDFKWEQFDHVSVFRREMLGTLARWPKLYVAEWKRIVRKSFDEYCRVKGKPDIIHAHWALPAGAAAASISHDAGIPHIITEHSSSYYCARWLPAVRLTHALSVLQSAQRVLVVSPQFGRFLESTFGAAMPGWTYVPNCLGVEFEKTIDRCAPGSQGTFEMLFVGRLVPYKGIMELIDAFARAFPDAEDQKCRLTIVGDGPLMPAVRERVQKADLGSRARILGGLKRPEVRDAMARADLYVQPSWYETFGQAIVESMACGCPILTTSCGGPEQTVDSGSGILVAPKSVPELTNGLKQMRSTITSYSWQQIRARCLHNFGRHRLVKDLGTVYQETIAEAHDRHELE